MGLKGGRVFYSVFGRLKTPPDYKPPPAKKKRAAKLPVLTERQMDIMSGRIAGPRKNEVSTLLEKLDFLEMKEDAERLLNRYAYLFTPYPTVPPRYTPEEAEGLLQSLTPWRMAGTEVHVDQTQTIYERIKAAVEMSGLSRAEISDRSGISQGMLSKYLSGKTLPRKDSVAALAGVLNVDPEWLSGRAEDSGTACGLAVLYEKLDAVDRRRVYGLAKALLKETRYKPGGRNSPESAKKAGH